MNFSHLLPWLSLILTVLALAHSIKYNRGRLPISWAIYFTSFLIVLAPLIAVAMTQPALIWSVFALKDLSVSSRMFSNLIETVRAIAWDGIHSPLLLPRVGLLNIVIIILGILGFMRGVITWRLQRSQLMLLSLFIAGAGAAISARNLVAYGYLLAVLYLFVARGLNQYLSEWTKRFPRNKSAKLASRLVLASLVAIVVLFNFQTYYVAWARSDHVRAQFDQQLLK